MDATTFFGVPFERIAEDHILKLKQDEVSEGYSFEFKRDFPRWGVGKSVAAFANTHGGFLLLGVEAEKERNVIIGVPGVKMEEGLQEKAKNQVLSSVNPLPLFRTSVVPLSESRHCVLVMEVPESSSPPHFTKDGRVYVRTPTGSDPVPETDRYTVEKLFLKAERSRELVEQLVWRKPTASNAIEAGRWGLHIAVCPAILDAFSLGLSTRTAYEKLRAEVAKTLSDLDHVPTQEGLRAFWREGDVYREILEIADNGLVCYFIQPEYESEQMSPGAHFLNLLVIEDRLKAVLSLARGIYKGAGYWGVVRLALDLSKVKGAALKVPWKTVPSGGPVFEVRERTRPDQMAEQDDYRVARVVAPSHLIDVKQHPKIIEGVAREVRRSFHYEAFDDE